MPLSIFTYAKTEPKVVLILSWIAIMLAAWELLTASMVHRDQGGEDGG